MNERPTPETDAFSVKFKSVCGSKAWVPTDICRRIERERDELIDHLESEKITRNAVIDKLGKAIKERDEAREELAEWNDSALHVRQEYDDEQHCSCVPILRKLLKDAERERDEARKELEEYRSIAEKIGAKKAVSEKEKAIRERDEAREALREIAEASGFDNIGNWARNKARKALKGAK